METILRKVSDEDMYYNFEDEVEIDTERIIIYGNHSFREFGDSVLLSIVSGDYYNQYHSIDNCNGDWYEDICELTYPAGTKDDKCVVSSSGYGDGCYICEVAEDNNEVVAIRIIFIEDDEEDEEEDYEDEEDEDEE